MLNKLQLNYDHIIRLHGLFANKNKRFEISKYFVEQVNGGKYCQHGCTLMLEHINTKTEDIHHDGGIDSLFSYLDQNGISQTQSNMLQTWCKLHEYDSESLCDDIQDLTNSNVFQKLNKNERHIRLIRKHMNVKAENNMNSLEAFLQINNVQ
eukprot:169094_1